jgi:hypothetical protein
MGHIPLRSSDGNLIGCLLRAREDDLAVPLFLQRIEFAETREELTVVQAVDIDDLGSKFGVLICQVSR